MPHRIAAVSFLNTIPLIEWFSDANRGPGADRAVLSRALPSALPDLLARGEAEVALIPVVEVFRGASALILPGAGITCFGNVDSVKLFHRGALQDLDVIRVDRGSRTSVALLEILMRERFGRCPRLESAKPALNHLLEPNEGVLIIGDRCFEFERAMDAASHLESTGIESVDLGGWWREVTGKPFVFAAWAVAPGIEANTALCSELTDLLTTARDYGLANLERLASREAARGRLGVGGAATTEAIAYYFQESLGYVVGDEETAGLERFFEFCVEYKLVPADAKPGLARG